MVSSARPTFSVIIPTYNRPLQLGACLAALAKQNLPAGFEVIVVDDGGDYDIDAVIGAWRQRLEVRCLRMANCGPSAARNHGAAAAKGAWLAFTDDDCEAAPEWLAALEAALENSPGALVGGRTVNALENNICAAASQLIQDLAYRYYNSGPAGPSFFAANNLAVPAEDFLRLGGFDSSFRTAEDRDLCDRWRLSGRPLVYAPKAVVRHRRPMRLGEFWRQHVGYGRGARRFQLAHQRRDQSSSTIRPDFYLWALRTLPRLLQDQPKRLRILALLAVWQAANTTGFLLEVLRKESRHAAE